MLIRPRWRILALLEVYKTIGGLPVAGGGSASTTIRSISLANKYTQIVRGTSSECCRVLDEWNAI